jgi:DNA-binding HxlR family transcriptional regulator
MDCPHNIGCIDKALAILGDKWSARILKELHDNGPRRFSDIASALPGLSPRTLSQRLDALASEGVIQRNEYCAHPVRCDYQLTDMGHDLVSVLQAMADWGKKYEPETSLLAS